MEHHGVMREWVNVKYENSTENSKYGFGLYTADMLLITKYLRNNTGITHSNV